MHTIKIEYEYAVSQRALFDALAAGALFTACGATPDAMAVDCREGGRYALRLGVDVVEGVFMLVDAPSTLVFTWTHGTKVTLITGSIGASDRTIGQIGSTGATGSADSSSADCSSADSSSIVGRSRLTLVHEDIPTEDLRRQIRAGWHGGVAALGRALGVRGGTGLERQVLEDNLEFYRKLIPHKVSGLDETDARRRLVPSLTTPIGLVKHLCGVERNWFQVHLGQRTREQVGPNNRGSDESWAVGPEETVASVIAEYETVCAESRRIAVQYDLDDEVPHPTLSRLSLRVIYVHLIEETARHAGHADILRELIDGVAGNDPE